MLTKNATCLSSLFSDGLCQDATAPRNSKAGCPFLLSKGHFPLLYFAATREKLRFLTARSFVAGETCAAPSVAENFQLLLTFT